MRASGPSIEVVGSQALFCAALRAVLVERLDAAVIDVAGDRSLERSRPASRPDLVLVDMGGDTTSDRHLRIEREGSAPVIVIDGDPDERRMVEAMEAGAGGYLSRLSPVDELLRAVDTVLGGHTYVPTDLLGTLLRSRITRRREHDEAVARFATLSRREVEVAGLICVGRDREQIAAALFISPATARTHVQHVITKLGVHSQLEVATVVRRYGLLDRVDPGGSDT